MPRYFFDVHDAGVQPRAGGDFDLIGTDLVDVAAAQRAAMLLLPAVAQDEPQLDRARRDLRVCVRDENGAIVYGARLVLIAGSTDPDAGVTDGATAEPPLAIPDGSVVSRRR